MGFGSCQCFKLSRHRGHHLQQHCAVEQAMVWSWGQPSAECNLCKICLVLAVFGSPFALWSVLRWNCGLPGRLATSGWNHQVSSAAAVSTPRWASSRDASTQGTSPSTSVCSPHTPFLYAAFCTSSSGWASLQAEHAVSIQQAHSSRPEAKIASSGAYLHLEHVNFQIIKSGRGRCSAFLGIWRGWLMLLS